MTHGKGEPLCRTAGMPRPVPLRCGSLHCCIRGTTLWGAIVGQVPDGRQPHPLISPPSSFANVTSIARETQSPGVVDPGWGPREQGIRDDPGRWCRFARFRSHCPPEKVAV